MQAMSPNTQGRRTRDVENEAPVQYFLFPSHNSTRPPCIDIIASTSYLEHSAHAVLAKRCRSGYGSDRRRYHALWHPAWPHGRMAHGPREPKLLMDVTPRILDWFDRHLGRVDTSE